MTLACEVETLTPAATGFAPMRLWVALALAVGVLATRSPEVREIVLGLLTASVVWIGALVSLIAVSPPDRDT